MLQLLLLLARPLILFIDNLLSVAVSGLIAAFATVMQTALDQRTF